MTIQLSTRELIHSTPLRGPRVLSEKVGLAGIRGGAKIATPQGWTAVGDLKVGDEVETLDGGVDQIIKIDRFDMNRDDHVLRPATWHMFFPVGAIGNAHEVLVSARQMLLLQSDAFVEECGARRALLQASDFFGMFGAFRVIPEGDLSLTVLTCKNPAVLIGKEGVMYHCAGLDNTSIPSDRTPAVSMYPKLVGRNLAKMIDLQSKRFREFGHYQCLSNNFAFLDDVAAEDMACAGH